MKRWFRAVSTLAIAGLVCAQAAPAAAAARDFEDRGRVNLLFDIVLLRPMGLATTVMGAGAFALISPIVAITRPQEFRKPIDFLVLRPARYTFQDPLGHH